MRRIWVSIVLLTGSVAHAEDPCAVPEDPGQPVTLPLPVKPFLLRGTVRGQTANELLAGATIVASRAEQPGGTTEVAITDEHGAYSMEVRPGTYEITIYYLDSTTTIARSLVVASDVYFAETKIDDSGGGITCLGNWGYYPSPELSSNPRHGIVVSRGFTPVSRDRTHRAWIAPAAAADPRIAVTTIDDGPRLQSAPGVPIAFLQEVATYTLRVPVGLAAGTGGAAAIALRSGSNQTAGDARLVFGLDHPAGSLAPSGGVEIVASGPIEQDKAWGAAGLVANRDADDVVGAHGMVQLNYARSSEHQLAIAGLAHAQGDAVRDGWSNARWVSKLDESRLELKGIVTAEQLELPASLDTARLAAPVAADRINRAGGRLAAVWRKRGLGYHQFAVSAGGGAGYRGDDRHGDATLAAGDEWQVKPNLELQYGVRSETRVFGAERSTVTSPRISLACDITREGRSDLFIAYQRVPHLDDGLPGDWRASAARFHDELAAGVSYVRGSGLPLMIGIGGRARWLAQDDTALGAEAWMRYDSRKATLHVAATTLGRVATVLAQRTLLDRSRNKLLGGATLRATREITAGGATLVWKHAGAPGEGRRSDDLAIDVSLEGYGSTDGPGGRLLLGATW